jgi:hypothetical protein
MFESVRELSSEPVPVCELSTEPVPPPPPTWVLKKMVTTEEYEYITAARCVLEYLTGEEFAPACIPWLRFADMQLESDAYCERLKMMINYEPVDRPLVYTLPLELSGLYYDADLYMQLLSHVDDARVLTCHINSTAVIELRGVKATADMINEIRNQLHGLTRTRVWVGSPRCRCPPTEGLE